MPIPYALIRPLFFSFDAERIHDWTLSFLEKTQNTPLSLLYSQAIVADPVRLCGLDFPNRIGLAAGLDKNARCIPAFSKMGFGFVEVGTVTPVGQSGNPKPRIFRIPQKQALINRLGFNNQGLESFINHVIQHQTQPNRAHMVLGLNIGKNAATPIESALDDYLKGLEGVYPYADYVTINISSPNTKNLRALQTDEALEVLLEGLSSKRAELEKIHAGKKVPMFIKIAPDLTAEQVELFVQTLKRHAPTDESARQGLWGVIATNTTLDKEAVKGMIHSDEAGGLSGAPVFEKSNAILSQLRSSLGEHFPLIGVGGVMSAQDACEKINHGANLVQIYSGLIYKGPQLIPQTAKALSQMAQRL
jgi:dihydroorotate dehydrogenase